MIEQQIERLLQEKFQEEAFQDCFLVELKLHPNNKLEVFLDSDTGITFETCRVVSRHLEAVLDAERWLGEKYTLEVSSPGVDRPLRLRRQYAKNVGRKLKVKLSDGNTKEGTLVDVTDEHVVLEEKVRVQDGKRKKTQTLQTEIPFNQIEQAKIQVSF